MVVVTTGATSVGAHERPCQLQWQNGQQAALTDLCGGGTDVHGERHHNHSCALPMGALSAERTCQDWQEKKKGKQEIASGSAPLKGTRLTQPKGAIDSGRLRARTPAPLAPYATEPHGLNFQALDAIMYFRAPAALLLLAAVLLAPATEAFLAPSGGLARDLARGRPALRSSSCRRSALTGLGMQAEAEPPQGPGCAFPLPSKTALHALSAPCLTRATHASCIWRGMG